MKNFSFALNGLSKSISSHQQIIVIQIWSTFLQIPDDILSANHKLILMGFMQLYKATHTQVNNVNFKINNFQLSYKEIGEMIGLNRFQVNRAITSLPEAVAKVKKLNLLGKGEHIIFKICDDLGNAIKVNKSGISSKYNFEYIPPSQKKIQATH